jgi:hypothetical protein
MGSGVGLDVAVELEYLKNAVFGDVTPYDSCKNIPSSPVLVILMMEAISSSETSVVIRVRRRHPP